MTVAAGAARLLLPWPLAASFLRSEDVLLQASQVLCAGLHGAQHAEVKLPDMNRPLAQTRRSASAARPRSQISTSVPDRLLPGTHDPLCCGGNLRVAVFDKALDLATRLHRRPMLAALTFGLHGRTDLPAQHALQALTWLSDSKCVVTGLVSNDLSCARHVARRSSGACDASSMSSTSVAN